MYITDLKDLKTFRSPEPHIRYGCVFYDETILPETKMGLYLLRFEPGGRSTKHVHKEEVEVFYCLRGRGRTVVAGKEIDLMPGRVVYIHEGEEHQTFCAGDEPFEMLCIFHPVQCDNPIWDWTPVPTPHAQD